MFKKYMLKLSNTVGTVNYLHKITKDSSSSDPNNNPTKRKHKKHCNNHRRNTMTAEMLLDIGAVPVVVFDDDAETRLIHMDCVSSRLAPPSDEEEEDDHHQPSAQEPQEHYQHYEKLPPDILSAAILNLRNTLMFYPLVH